MQLCCTINRHIAPGFQPMTLVYILLATFAGGILSVFAAATLSLTVLANVAHRMVALSVGILLAVAFLDLMPEAAEGLNVQSVGGTILVGILLFFVLEKTALWRHDHAHEQHEKDGHSHVHSHSPTGMMIILGSAMHNFVDGVLVSATFIQDPKLGLATAIAVIAHEIPHEIGDFIVLLAAGYSRKASLWLNVLAGSAAVLGGIIGWATLQGLSGVIPYVMALATASFIYIAVADLIPELQEHRRPHDFPVQLGLLLAGISIVMLGMRLES
jgi:zinc and cadmium transporter